MEYIKNDYDFGITNEKCLLDLLKEKFDNTLEKTHRTCVWDFEGNDYIMELKTRRNAYDKYPTTLIPQNKITKMMENNKKKYLVFKFTDGVYGCPLNDTTITDFNQHQKGGRADRGFCEYKKNGYCYIPIDKLDKIFEV